MDQPRTSGPPTGRSETEELHLSATPTSSAPEGIHADRVTEWFTEHVEGVVAPLRFELIAGGHSNLTYAVTDRAGSRWVLRRPPLGHVLATAHDMGREHRIISALQGTAVPVPVVEGLCQDDGVNDAPFYVMRFVDGRVVRSPADAAALDPAARRRSGESLVDVLAAIHQVDVEQVGLSELGRHDGYVARQLRRWYGQFEQSVEQEPGLLGLPAIHDVHAHLSANIPEQQGVSIVHGDYRLDNCMLDDTGEVVAVLDWEICTLGDPLADLGLLCVYWTDPDGVAVLPQAAPTTLDGFMRSSELVERYAARSDLDLSGLDYYVTFGFWKLTCIIAGVYARYAGGAMGDVPASQVDGFKVVLDQLAQATLDSVSPGTGGGPP